MIFRLTQKLAGKIKAGPLAAAPQGQNPYADWSAQLFRADRTQYILLCNTASLYSVVMYGRGVTDHHAFITRALAGIRDALHDDGLTLIYRRFIATATGSVRFSKALNRSVTGSMNELVKEARFCLETGAAAPQELALHLNSMPLSMLPSNWGDHYGVPGDAFRRLRP
jgi:hypothetical protein